MALQVYPPASDAGKQPIDPDLTAIAALDSSTAGVVASDGDGSGWIRKSYAAVKTALGVTKSDVGLSNVNDTADTAKPVSTAQQTALDLKANLASPTFTGTVGGITKTMVGLPNVDNTTDASKPVSTLQQTALDAKAPLASPTLTGTPSAPTATTLTSTTQLATTAFVTLADTAASTLDRDRTNHTGTQSADTLTDGTTNKAFLATERTKLTGINSGATVNSTDATLLARVNHTGTQLAATISDFSTAADARIGAQRGAASGLVPLESNSKILSTYLPAIAITSVYTVATQAAQLAISPVPQEGDVAIRTDLNQTYIHNGGTAVSMADWTLLSTPTDAVTSVAGRTGVVTLAKADVGLGNVDNISDASKPVSTAQAAADDLRLPLAGSDGPGGLAGATVTGSVIFKQATAGFSTINTRVGIETNNRLSIAADGTLTWGSGAAGGDTTLYRSSADILKTDDTFNAVGGVQINGTSVLARSTHTGSQLAATISDFSTAVDARITSTSPVTSVATRTGNVVLTKTDVGLGSVDNTADTAKPVSTAQATALALKADLAAPSFTGLVTSAGRMAITDGVNTTGGLLIGADTNLYRASTDALRTDDTFQALRVGIGRAPDAATSLLIGTVDSTTTPFGSATQEVIAFRNSDTTTNNMTTLAWRAGDNAIAAGLACSIDDQTLHYGTFKFYARGADGFLERFRIGSDGKLTIGTAGDTNLYRSAADALKTDDSFGVGAHLTVAGNTTLSSTTSYLSLGTDNTSQKIYFGATSDTNLYRSAADRLKTDDALHVTKGLAVGLDDAGIITLGAAADVQLSRSAAGTLSIIGSTVVNSNDVGKLYFGSAADTNLYRSAADTLKTDDTLTVAGALNAQGNVIANGLVQSSTTGTAFYHNPATAAGNALSCRTGAEANQKFLIDYAGVHSWGAGGATAVDTNLYRSAVDTLKTDDSLIVGANMAIGTATPSGSYRLQIDSATNVYGISLTNTVAGGTTVPQIQSQELSAAGMFLGSHVSAQSFRQWQVYADGKHEWGSGDAALDTNLYRSAANTLNTDDSFVISPNSASWALSVNNAGAGGGVTAVMASSASLGYRTRVSGDANGRWDVTAGGLMSWGDGGATQDTNLYRPTPDTLKTDDTFNAVAGVQVNGTSVLARSTHTGTQLASTVSDFSTAADARITAQKGAASGLAPLDSGSLIPVSYLPAITISSTFTVATQAAQLALTAQEGDVAIRTDLSQTYIHNGGLTTSMAGWTLLATPTGAVTSVAGRTGVITLSSTDVGLANVDNTADTAKPVSTAQQTALNLKANLASPTFTGTVAGITKTMVGLGNVDDTADSAKPVSTAQAAADALKLSLTGGTMTGALIAPTPLLITGSSFPGLRLSKTDLTTVGQVQVGQSGDMYVDYNMVDAGQSVLFRSGSANTNRAGLSSAGQFQLPATGSTGGLVVGGDTNLYRFAADQLKTDDNFVVGIDSIGTRDTYIGFNNTGKAYFGSAADTNLYRSAADTLKTDDSFIVGGNFTVTGTVTAPVSGATQTALNLKADLASPTFTGTVAGITKSMVSLGNVDNTADSAKPVSTLQAAADTAVQNFSIARANHTGTQSADTLTDGTTNKAFLATERTKLTGITTAATANSTDATLLARANHTGTQLAATVSDFSTAADARITVQKGAASGLAPLDSGSKIASSYLPAIAITSTSTVASEVAQLALTAQEGDVAIRTDLSQTYIHNGGVAGTIADWSLLATPTGSVTSVAGRTGVITLSASDVGLANVTNTSDAAKPVSTAQQTALNLKADLASPSLTGVPVAPTATALTSTTQLATTAFVTAADTALSTSDRARANHTGTQLAATISDFSTAADARITVQKGAASGLAPLDSGSKIAASYLPAIDGGTY